MDSKEPNKYIYKEKMKAAAQLKRRNTYSEISSILQNSTLAVPEQPTSSWCSSRVPKQVALTIREPLSVVQKAARPQLSVSTSDNNKEKGKDLCTSSVISETGSVSNTSNQALQIQNTIPTKETVKSSTDVKEATECLFERSIIVAEEDLLLQTKLNTQQRIAYDTILDRIFSNKSGAFFIDGPGGTDGQLYVALSRARSSNCVKILIRPPTPDDDDDHSTYNIVYNEIIQKAFT